MGQVPVVAAEEFVATIPREDDRHVLAGDLGDIPGRDGGRIGERFVEMTYQLIEDAERVRTDNELMMLGAEVIRYGSSVLEFIELRIIETNREGLDRTVGCFGHEADHGARVDSA